MKTIRKSQYNFLKMLQRHAQDRNQTVTISDEEYEELQQYVHKPITIIDNPTPNPEQDNPTPETQYDYKNSDFGLNGIGYKIISLEERTVKVWVLCIHDNVIIPNEVIYNNIEFKVIQLCGEYWGPGWGASNTCNTITFNKYIDMNNCGNELYYLNINYVYVDEENPYMTTINGVLYNKDITKLLRYTNNNEEFIIPNSVLELENYCFSGNKDICKKIIFNDNIETLPQETFYVNHNLEYIKLSNNIRILPSGVFNNLSNLKTLVLPSQLEQILTGEYHYYWSTSLENITVYNSNIVNYKYVQHIQRWYGDGTIAEDRYENTNIYVFNKLTNLKELHVVDENPVELKDGIFTDGKYFTLKVYVPQGCKEIYQNTAGWNKFYNIIEE